MTSREIQIAAIAALAGMTIGAAGGWAMHALYMAITVH